MRPKKLGQTLWDPYVDEWGEEDDHIIQYSNQIESTRPSGFTPKVQRMNQVDWQF